MPKVEVEIVQLAHLHIPFNTSLEHGVSGAKRYANATFRDIKTKSKGYFKI